ncbi:MAG: class I SAM-dependent methyltransferase [Candidatus Eremiobacteraeota bacterium]|nr:class I SAM-dependent methyltransferase [Candidatus Eremiobacteraeota bacterium]
MPPTPDTVLRYTFAHVPARALSTAVELDLFNHLASGPMTVEELATLAKASARGIRLLTDALWSMELLEREGDKLKLSEASEAFLVEGRPGYLGGLTRQSDMSWHSWAQLTPAVVSGTTPVPSLEGDRGEFFAAWVDALFNLNYPAAQAAARHWAGDKTRVLDIGAGSGVWSLAAAEASPQARVTAVDLQPVLDRVTSVFAQKHGVEDRYEFRVGDFHTVDFGDQQFDLAYLGHILHSEGDEGCKTLLERIYRALKPGGVLVIAEMIPDFGKRGHLFPFLFGLNMLVHTHQGDVYTREQLETMCRQAGFTGLEWLDVPAPHPLLGATK